MGPTSGARVPYAWFQGSGPGSSPLAARASLGRKCCQPVAWTVSWPGARPRWIRRNRVPDAIGVRVNSTWVAPGGMSVLPATPQLTRTRRGGSISRYCPRIGTPLMSISKAPPGTGLRVACWPIQRIIAAGSVRCRKTSSAGAGRSTSVSKWSVIVRSVLRWRLAGLGQGCCEPAEALGPEAGEELLHRAETGGIDHEQMAGALPVLVDQAGLAQDLQVPGKGLWGDVEVAGDVADRAGIVGDELEDGAAVRLGERFEGGVRVHGCRPRKATRRWVIGASAATVIAGPMRGARVCGVMACSAKPNTCVARRPSRSAGWAVALARSQPCTRMSRVVNPARAGPGISPSGVVCARLRASPAPAAARAAAVASA